MGKLIYGDWGSIAECDCGYQTECLFGRLFYLTDKGNRHTDVCPECGRDKFQSMVIKTARRVFYKKRWWWPSRFVRWEIKEGA